MQNIYTSKFNTKELPFGTAIKISYKNQPSFNALVTMALYDKIDFMRLALNDKPMNYDSSDIYGDIETILISEIDNGTAQIEKLG